MRDLLTMHASAVPNKVCMIDLQTTSNTRNLAHPVYNVTMPHVPVSSVADTDIPCTCGAVCLYIHARIACNVDVTQPVGC